MQKFKLLVLTDHTNHSTENSVYTFVKIMRQHPRCTQVDVASRGNPANASFFNLEQSETLTVSTVEEDFAFHTDGRSMYKNQHTVRTTDYDLIWMRMPPPLTENFVRFIENTFADQFVFNAPKAVYETGSKAFLLNFAALCPPMQICQTVEDIIAFKSKFPIVLKPFRDFGGRGIVKIDGDDVSLGQKTLSFEEFAQQLQPDGNNYLGVKFLKNVGEGDKRIIVVNGKILGASLRLPPKDSWICNVSAGGSSNLAKVDEREREIVATINQRFSKMGIVMYGVDTLVGDEGERVLSEINTTSIGGLPQIAALNKEPVVEEAVHLIWDYFLANSNY